MVKPIQLQERRSNISFLQKVNSGKGDQLFLMKGENNGNPAWYYLLVDKLKLALLQRDIQNAGSDVIDLQKYGTVVRHGWGKEPPESVKEEIEKTYG